MKERLKKIALAFAKLSGIVGSIYLSLALMIPIVALMVRLVVVEWQFCYSLLANLF